MNVLDVVLTRGTMDLQQAIRELGLNKEKYAKLADIENLPIIAQAIRKITKRDT
jgi:hypothetical protein